MENYRARKCDLITIQSLRLPDKMPRLTEYITEILGKLYTLDELERFRFDPLIILESMLTCVSNAKMLKAKLL